MNTKDIHVGGIYLAKDNEGAVRTVKVLTASGQGVTVVNGRYDAKTEEFKKLVIVKGDQRITEFVLPFSAFQEMLFKGAKVNMPSKKKDDKEVQPLLKPSEKGKGGKGSAREVAASGKQGKADKIKTDRKAAASKKKEKTEEQKAADKAQKSVDKLAKSIRAKLADTDLKEKDIVAQFGVRPDDQPKVAKLEKLTEDEANKALEFVKEKAKDAKKQAALSKKTALTDEESQTRKEMERQVKKSIDNYQHAVMEVGSALAVINEQRLYRNTHDKFNDYVIEVFDLSPAQAYSVMQAAVTFKMIIGDNVELNAKNLPSIRAAEAIQRSTNRLLAESGNKGADDEKFVTQTLARNIYNLAIQTAPVDKAGKPILSPAHLDSVSTVLNDIAKTGAVEVDGKQVPLNVARAAIGESVAELSAERQKRLNQYLADTIESKREAFKASFDQKNARGGTGRLDTAINNATGIIGEIPEGVTPKLTLNCSVHGRSALDVDMDEQHLILSCGCEFLMTPEGLTFSEWIKPKEKPAEAVAGSATAS